MRSGFYLYEIFLKYLQDFSQWVFPLMFMRFFSNCEIFLLCLWDFSQIWRFSSNFEINLINQWGNQTLGGVQEELLQYLQDLMLHLLLWDISGIAMVFLAWWNQSCGGREWGGESRDRAWTGGACCGGKIPFLSGRKLGWVEIRISNYNLFYRWPQKVLHIDNLNHVNKKVVFTVH